VQKDFKRLYGVPADHRSQSNFEGDVRAKQIKLSGAGANGYRSWKRALPALPKVLDLTDMR